MSERHENFNREDEPVLPQEPDIEEPKNNSETDKVSRRQALKRIGIGLATVAVAGTAVEGGRRVMKNTKESKKIAEDTEKSFGEFPEEVSGIKKIEKRDAEGAKHLFILIRQEHVVEGLDALVEGEEGLDEANNVQKDIYDALLDLKQKIGIKSVFCEGLAVEGEEQVKQTVKEQFKSFVLARIRPHLPELDFAISDIAELRPEMESIRKMSKEEIDGMSKEEIKQAAEKIGRSKKDLKIMNDCAERYKYAAGAAEKLYNEGAIDISGGESEARNNEAFKMLHRIEGLGLLLNDEKASEEDRKGASELLGRNKEKWMEAVFAEREKYLLEKVSNGGTISVCTFGGAHKFADDIDEWNKKHPGNRISSIILTPEHLIDTTETKE
ncbi:MAG: hypothetical protein NT094_05270 [Candidatus Staskawiczbacteria bacterium]|nr:hypothetical protein [Candidatus Staskawiczbacteria bacterium]